MNGIARTHDAAGYLQDKPSPPPNGSLKRVRSQEDPFAYDPTPSGDDGDQPKEDTNRAKSYVLIYPNQLARRILNANHLNRDTLGGV